MQVDKELKDQAERYESIFNATSDSIIIYNEEGYIVEANPSASTIFGYDYQELLGMHVSKLYLHPQDFFILRDTAFSGQQYSGTHTRIKKNGDHVQVNFTGVQFIFDGKPHVLSAAKDVTAQIKAERALKKMQDELRTKEKKTMELLEQKVKERTSELEKTNFELMQFTSVASHDLKEPIRKISIYGLMLKERIGEALDPTSSKYLNNMITSAARMSTLIDDLLSFSKLSQKHIQFEKVDLNQLITQTLEDLEITINEKNATFKIDKLPVIDGIALQLGQVFQNLISNSLKFAHPERAPVITLTCESYEENGSTFYSLTYQDNGIGFKPEYSEKIFEVFQRLHTRTQYEGTGVGLAIVKKIISLHKGQIIATGRENLGAEFLIVLPEKQ